MSVDIDAQQYDGEEVLHDVLHIICKYMKSKDLFNMSQVCLSWQFAATQENNNRTRIQQFYLPYEIDDLDNRLYVNPKASLLVYDSKLEKSPLTSSFPGFDSDNRILAREVLNKFKSQIPNKVIVLGVDEHVTTFVAEQLESHPDAPAIYDDEQSGNVNILGMFIPGRGRQIRVHVAAHCRIPLARDNRNRAETINRLAGKLGLYELCEPYPRSTIIQFAVIGGRDHTVIGELAKRAQKNGKELSWTSIFGGKLMAEDTMGQEHRRPNWTTTAFIRISGPCVESWSTFIHIRSERDQIRKKFEELNASVKRKRYNHGFIYAPTCDVDCCTHANHPCGDSIELVMILNRVFPDIRFTGFFLNSNVYKRIESGHPIFPDQFHEQHIRNFDKEFLTKLPYYVSAMVLSYD